jgi:phenylpyruvate tautomerase
VTIVPYFSVQTNQTMTPTEERAFTSQAVDHLEALLGKSRAYIMVSLQSGQSLVFGGNSAPAAYVQLKSIGLEASQCPDLAQAISEMLEARLSLPPDRVYIEFHSIDRALFAWNGNTFA